MEKGQVGVFNTETKQIYKNWANPNTDRWRTGVLSFDDQYLRDVILEIEKEFDIEVILERTDLEGCKITTRLENSTADDAMQYLAKTFEMKLKIENEIEYHLLGGVSCIKKVTYQ
jgi:ferric-dicitrate binding protein FerR (iron transport regulator)